MEIILIIFLILTVIALILACSIYKIKYKEEKIQHRKTKNKMMEYEEEAEFYKRECQKNKYRNPQNIHPDALDAIRYAMIKSHPDNGGNKDNFIRFSDCYNNLKKAQSK